MGGPYADEPLAAGESAPTSQQPEAKAGFLWNVALDGWLTAVLAAILFSIGYSWYRHRRERLRAERVISRELNRNIRQMWFHLGGAEEVTSLVRETSRSIPAETGKRLAEEMIPSSGFELFAFEHYHACLSERSFESLSPIYEQFRWLQPMPSFLAADNARALGRYWKHGLKPKIVEAAASCKFLKVNAELERVDSRLAKLLSKP